MSEYGQTSVPLSTITLIFQINSLICEAGHTEVLPSFELFWILRKPRIYLKILNIFSTIIIYIRTMLVGKPTLKNITIFISL